MRTLLQLHEVWPSAAPKPRPASRSPGELFPRPAGPPRVLTPQIGEGPTVRTPTNSQGRDAGTTLRIRDRGESEHPQKVRFSFLTRKTAHQDTSDLNHVPSCKACVCSQRWRWRCVHARTHARAHTHAHIEQKEEKKRQQKSQLYF